MVTIASAPQESKAAPFSPLRGRFLKKCGAVLVFVLAWHAASSSGLVREQIVPRPLTVLSTFLELTFDWSDFARSNLQNQLVLSALLTIARVMAGLTTGIILGVIVGYIVGWYPVLGFPVDCVVRALRTIPGLAWVPLAIAWFGVTFLGPIFIVSLSTFFPIAISTIHGVRAVNPVYIQTMLTLGGDDRTIMRDVVLPSA